MCSPTERRPSIRQTLTEHPMAALVGRDGLRARRRAGLERTSSCGVRLEFPATNAHVTALGMATFYNALAQEKLLSVRAHGASAGCPQGGFDTDVVLGPRVADHGWGLGYMLNQRGVARPEPADLRPWRLRRLVRVRRPRAPHRLRVRDELLRRHEVQRRSAQRGALRRGLLRSGRNSRLIRGPESAAFLWVRWTP